MIYDEIAMNAACMFENSVTILNRKMNEGIIKSTTNNKNGYLDASLFVPIVVIAHLLVNYILSL